MITVDTILVSSGISAFILLIGIVIYSINDYNEERKSNKIEGYSSLIGEEDTNNHII
jgi:hypothetical protein